MHAKLYLAPGKAAMIGSSNLTFGGGVRNDELNIHISSATMGYRKMLNDLLMWFETIWGSKSARIEAEDLDYLNSAWQASEKKVQGLIAQYLPEPALGGNYWEKWLILQEKDEWEIEEVEEILRERDTAQNSTNKLVFLSNLGLLRFTNKEVKVLRRVESPRTMFGLLENTLHVSLESVLRNVCNSEESVRTVYANDDFSSNARGLRVAVNWLIDLGFISRDAKGRRAGRKDLFHVTEAGHLLLKSMERPELNTK